ncbi:MAG: hypothetical protein QOI76_1932 [Frankiales bacterium]|nr:hypothetical protein [Frankiales bacterium]
MGDADETTGTPAEPVNLVNTAIDLTLGLVALGAASLRAAPELAAKLPVRAAGVALVASERAQQEIDALLVRGAELRGTLGGLLAGRLLGPPIVEDEPAEVDPFDLILLDDDPLETEFPGDEAADEAPRTPLVVVAPTVTVVPDVSPDGLPLEGFDEMSLGAMRAKARQLGIGELETLLDHERTHGRRDGVLSLLETRIAQLQQEQSAG